MPMPGNEVLEQRLRHLEEILDLQSEIGEDTSIVIGKIREVESLLKENQ